jgi:hypothetical protein
MPLPANIFSSRLEPLAPYLARGIDSDSGLLEVLENLLPPKKLDAVVKLLDKLLEHPLGAQVLLLTMRFRLDEWLEAGEKQLQRTNQDIEPFDWLATNDHLEVVQTFRELL